MSIHVGTEEGGVSVFSRPKGAWRASWKLSSWARQALYEPLEKPMDEVRRAAPDWLRDLTFAFDLLFRVFEFGPGGVPVRMARFENPPAGFVVVPSDLEPSGGPVAEACARSAMGNMVEDGLLILNDEYNIRFDCDCRSKVYVWMRLAAEGRWLLQEDLRRIALETAQSYNLTIEMSPPGA